MPRPENRRCLVSLARGGADASVVREFDTVAKSFVEGPRAFVLPEAKSDVTWIDGRHVLRRHRFRSGLDDRLGLPEDRQALAPRHVRSPKRPIVFEGTTQDVAVA
jgi:prolyl oligopeptidase